MGSPLGPVLANIFMCDFEEKWVRTSKNRSSVWFRYVDNIFALFDDRKPASQFLQYPNSRHNNIKFAFEFEENEEIPFLDILVKRCPSNAFMTSIYRKKTFTDLYTKWDSFTSRKYEVNLIRNLTYRCFRICSSVRCFNLLSAICENLSFKMAALKE